MLKRLGRKPKPQRRRKNKSFCVVLMFWSLFLYIKYIFCFESKLSILIFQINQMTFEIRYCWFWSEANTHSHTYTDYDTSVFEWVSYPTVCLNPELNPIIFYIRFVLSNATCMHDPRTLKNHQWIKHLMILNQYQHSTCSNSLPTTPCQS